MTSPSGSSPDEARAFLDAHPAIEAVDILLTDVNGIGRGKIIRRHELMALYEKGRHLPISILGLDIVGEDVHETGLIWDSGDGDLRGWPIPGTLVPLHGTSPPRAQALMSMYHLDGTPMSSDPRHALMRQVKALAAQGLHPAGAFELEFFLLSPERDRDGRMRAADAVLDDRRSAKTEVYSVDHLHGMEPLFADIYADAKAHGNFLVTIMQENALHGWKLADGKHMRMTGYPTKIKSWSWSVKGRWLATSGANAAIVWPFQGKDGPMGKSPLELGTRGDTMVTAVACHPTDEITAIGYSDGMILAARFADQKEVLLRRGGKGAITSMAWDRTSARLAFGAEAGDCGVVDIAG